MNAPRRGAVEVYRAPAGAHFRSRRVSGGFALARFTTGESARASGATNPRPASRNLFPAPSFISQMHTDDVLMRQVVAGDDDAFGTIVDRYKHSLVNYLTHLIHSRDRAEELAQDAFVRLYRNAANYREQEKLGPYLFRIATNLVVTEVRREKRWTLLLPRFQAGATKVAPPPDRPMIESEIQRQVSAALERIPVKYRAPLVLFEIEEWSYEEIGRALDLRSGTVKSRISRARELMRRELAPWWIGGQGHHERTRAERVDSSPAAHERIAVIRP